MSPTEAEIEELYVRYAHVIHYRARNILGTDEDAADAVQETFARVIRHWEQFRAEASPLTWMYQISTNHCLNQLRNRKGHAKKHEDRREDIVGAAHGAAVEPNDDHTIRALLAEADEETRKILIHLYFDDMTREDTARAVGISQPTLRKRLDQFFKRARVSLGITLTAALLLGLGASLFGGRP